MGPSREGVVREGGLEGSWSEEVRRTSSSSGATWECCLEETCVQKHMTAPHGARAQTDDPRGRSGTLPPRWTYLSQ